MPGWLCTEQELHVLLRVLLQEDPAKALTDAERLKRQRMEEEESERSQRLLLEQVGVSLCQEVDSKSCLQSEADLHASTVCLGVCWLLGSAS